jgi:GNAT superfamily N-acetyltransferase
MKPQIVVGQATSEEFDQVGHLVYALLTELYPDLPYERSAFIDAARTLLETGRDVWSFLARAPDGRAVGVVTLNECAAIYAGGHFGEISEFYVVPDFRSKGVGALLLEAAVEFGRQRGWSNIEVGAPRVPAWQRTFDFYRRNGFEEVGPRLDLALHAED